MHTALSLHIHWRLFFVCFFSILAKDARADELAKMLAKMADELAKMQGSREITSGLCGALHPTHS
jgi:hypothetical protein